MKRLVVALTAIAAFTAPALAADMAVKAPLAAPVAYAPSWTGFYIGGGGGYGMWTADTTTQSAVTGICVLCTNQWQGGKGYFGSVSGGFDWQFGGSWVLGVFGDGQFGEIKGTIQDQGPFFVGETKLRTSYAAGARLGYLVAPNVLSYVNAGYSGSEWSDARMVSASTGIPNAAGFSTPSFRRDGWFVGGGVEHSLGLFGIKAPGWFVKTEYRLAEYDRIVLPDVNTAGGRASDITFKPWVQTIKTELVYRFNSGGMAAQAPMRAAPVAYAPSWTGIYIGGGGGYGMWTADTTTQSAVTGICVLCTNQRQGGKGYFGSVSGGFDWQFGGSWVAGVFGDGQFGELKGTIQDQGPFFAGEIKLRNSYAAGARLGYLVAPNVLSYVNAGYSGSEWSGANMVTTFLGAPTLFSTPSFHRDGWFVGGGAEHSLDLFSIKAPGWFVKTEYRLAEYDRIVLPDSTAAGGRANDITFKPWVQTIKTELVYRFNWAGGPVVAKY